MINHDEHETPITCFWNREDDPYADPIPCTNAATHTIYWDAVDQPICDDCLPDAIEARYAILADIDDKMGR